MERPVHTLSNLFAQLGRPSDEAAIQQFIATNRPLPGAMRLDEASCWTAAQAAFLRDSILDDGDWAAVVDDLNSRLHSPN